MESPIYQELQNQTYLTRLANETNGAVLIEETDFARNRLTLDNYFYKLTRGYHLSEEQKRLYQILGDVNPQYALKYMTTFLMKFLRRDRVVQKRRDIFVDALLLLGYIQPTEDGGYQLHMDMDENRLEFRVTGEE